MDQKDFLEVQLMSKNTGLAAVLGLVFGGFGLFYVSILNGLVGSIIEVVLLLVLFITAGLGIVLYIPWHILCLIVAISMANSHNKRLLKKVSAHDALLSLAFFVSATAELPLLV